MPTVLIIDDSPTQVACLRELLSGIRILHRGSDALKEWQMRPAQIDLVIIALILTHLNGFECGLRLREFGFTNIVLYSDCPEETDAAWARTIGLQGLLQLPAPRHDLHRQIQSYLNSSERGIGDGKRWAS